MILILIYAARYLKRVTFRNGIKMKRRYEDVEELSTRVEYPGIPGTLVALVINKKYY